MIKIVEKTKFSDNEKKILSRISELNKVELKSLNKRRLALNLGMALSTLRDNLTKLEKKGFLKRDEYFYDVTNRGNLILDKQNHNAVRKPKQQNTISTHKIKYNMKIKDSTNFSPDRLVELNPNRTKHNPIKNMETYYAYFNDATITFTKHTVRIEVHDVVADDTLESNLIAFEKAMNYVSMIQSIGIVGRGITMDDNHYATLETYFAEVLQKFNNNFFVDLGNGSKFWIDYSNDTLEEETDDPLAHERIRRAIKQISNNDLDLTDIEDLKEVSANLTKVCVMQHDNFQNTQDGFKQFNSHLRGIAKASSGTAQGLRALTDFAVQQQQPKQEASVDLDPGEIPRYIG